MAGRFRLWCAVLAVVPVVGLVAWLVLGSRAPGSAAATEMGYPDLGGGASMRHSHTGHVAAGPGGNVSVAALLADRTRPADVVVTLTARVEATTMPDGTAFEGYTVNGTTPGPTLTAATGQLVEVRFNNDNIADGATLHWHGINVPNGEDGVAGVTQDAVAAGQTHTYRFVAPAAGTYWYHSHQLSHEQVLRGLLGAIVITAEPNAPASIVPGSDSVDQPPVDFSTGSADVVALLHTYDGRRMIGGRLGDLPVELPVGTVARVRVINTDNGPTQVWVSGAPFRLLAVDGQDLTGPGEVSGVAVTVTAGARADLEVRVPEDGVRVEMPGAAVVLGPARVTPSPTPVPAAELDLLSYGTPAPFGFDPAQADRRFDYRIGRRFGVLEGRPGLWWTVNDRLYPDLPMFMVAEGDVVVMRISNESGEVHPMHLHGHHVTVLTRNGVASTGSPWRVDSLNVRDGESYDVAFVADNPGVWMDHCHNLKHPAEGLIVHLAYDGVSTPFRMGRDTGNVPE